MHSGQDLRPYPHTAVTPTCRPDVGLGRGGAHRASEKDMDPLDIARWQFGLTTVCHSSRRVAGSRETVPL